jgi:hypothetical protein
MLGFPTSHASWLSPMYKYMLQQPGESWVLFCCKFSFSYFLVSAVSIRLPVCLIQDPNSWFSFSLWLDFHELFACSSCACLFSIASRFKGVLGTSRTSQSEMVYLLLRRSLVGVVVWQPTSNPPPNRVIPSSHRRLGTYPNGFYHVVIRARFSVRVSTHTLHYLQSRNPKNRLDPKIPTTSLSLCCST